MLPGNSGLWFVAGGVGLFLAGLITAALHQVAYRRLVQAVAEQLARVEAPPLMRTEAEKRHKAHWGAVQVSERATSLALQTIEDAQVLYARQQNLLLLMEWVRSGGNPEAPWPDIVRWKNAQNGGTK